MQFTALFALLPLLATTLAAPTSASKRDTGVVIYAGRDGKCLSLPAGASPGDGTPVVSRDCDGQGVSRWDINRGSGSIVLAGTNYAMDIGLNPGNNGGLKVWTSYPTAPQQTWFYTGDNRIAQTGGTQCLDEGTNGIQTYQCTTGNTNQIFYTRSGSGPPPSSSAGPTSSSSAAPPPASSSATPPPPSNSRLIKANAYDNLCLTVQDYTFDDGTPVQLSNCFDRSDRYRSGQIWTIPNGGTGAIKINGKCLDAGDNPADGSGMKIWTCYDGLLQQTWTYGANGNLISLANNQCLDVRRESGPAGGVIYGREKTMQTWTCSSSDPQQQFTLANA